MGPKENITESEKLREALLDLERANTKERNIRLEAEALILGLRALTNYESREKMFSNLLEVLRGLISFDDAFVLVSKNELAFRTVACTSPRFEAVDFPLKKIIGRISMERPLAFFDIGMVPEWKVLQEDFLKNIHSLLLVRLREQPHPAVLVCTHSTRGFFSEKHLRLSVRFANLASQALKNFDYTLELEEINKRLSQEINERQKAQDLADSRLNLIVNSSKMVALGEMAGGIAHEINSPLAIISLKIEQILESLENNSSDADLKKDVLLIRSTTERIAKIVKGMRLFARDGETTEMQTASISGLIEDTVSLCRERFRNHGVRIEVVGDFDKFKVVCRSVEISQVLLNLMNNAYDAIEDLKDKWIEISVSETVQWIEIRVTDSGTGISHDVQQKIFQPFFTTKEMGKGTGMGLSISLGIIKNHHGELTLDPQSKHTSFVIRLPIKA